MRHSEGSQWSLVGLAMASVGVIGCGAVPPSSSTLPPTLTPSCTSPTREFRVGLAQAGAPNPSDPGFRSDQDGQFDTHQFGNPSLYPPGYHWRVDRALPPHSVLSAELASDPDRAGRWVAYLTLTKAGQERLNIDSAYALSQPAGTPGSHLALFAGPEVLVAPQVVELPSAPVAVSLGNVTDPSVAEALINNIC